MKKSLLLSLLTISFFIVSAQDTAVAPKPKKDWSKVNMNRSNDHLLIQLGINSWANMPDSIQTKGLSRTFNIYFMMDFPFKTNPHFSVAAGVGVGSDNMYFKDTYIDISGKTQNALTFQNVADTNHFKKFKLNTTYAEIPVEFRYIGNPENPGRSFKLAVGAKIGTMLNASTKGKNLLNKGGGTVNAFVQKEKAKRFFNKTRFAVMGRLGYGSFSVFATYQVNSFVKEGFGPDVKPFTIGLTISGL